MKETSNISQIDNLGLCLGCGLCESVCGKENVEMRLLEDGFFHPVVAKVLPEKEEIIKRICPGVNVVNDILFSKEESIWGRIDRLYSGFSTDSEVRKRGSSGGIVSGLGIFVLENNLVDGVMQVGGNAEDYERNELRISYSRNEILECASSRYAPALIFNKILEILDRDNKSYCFIGKPCDISGLKNFLQEYPLYKSRFKLTVSIMCAGLPSFNGTLSIINQFNATLPVKDLVYRGNGWPGFFSFIDRAGRTYQKSYNDSWGKTLNKYLKFRCKICPDGIGLQADIAVGDAWETSDGYPDFTEREGNSLIISRTEIGSNILLQAFENSKVHLEDLHISKIEMMQPYQHMRRRLVGARILAFRFLKTMRLNFANMHIIYNLSLIRKRTLVKEFIGTFKRVLKSNHN